MTKHDATVCAFATLRFAGDALDPADITRILKKRATRAYRKGETYRPGPRSPEVIGKTGLWYFSTRRRVASGDLDDHLDVLVRLLLPQAELGGRVTLLHELMRREGIEAYVTCFWRGHTGATAPAIPSRVEQALDRLPAAIERDFDTVE